MEIILTYKFYTKSIKIYDHVNKMYINVHDLN